MTPRQDTGNTPAELDVDLDDLDAELDRLESRLAAFAAGAALERLRPVRVGRDRLTDVIVFRSDSPPRARPNREARRLARRSR